MDTSDELVTSLAVESELAAGEFLNKADMLALASRFPLLDVNDSLSKCQHYPTPFS